MKRVPQIEVGQAGVPHPMHSGAMTVLDLIAEDAVQMPSHMKMELDMICFRKLRCPCRQARAKLKCEFAKAFCQALDAAHTDADVFLGVLRHRLLFRNFLVIESFASSKKAFQVSLYQL
jgi:hypothetical protein